jgi:hypothetical protein
MKKYLIVFLFFPINFALAKGIDHYSQKRLPNESFEEALARNTPNFAIKKAHRFDKSALNAKKPYSLMTFEGIPKLNNYAEFIALFQYIRDTRFLFTADKQSFPRRISWLYPDDGCFVRAALGGMMSQSHELIRPKKIFAFGALTVSTPYSPYGSVSWWYHVALIVNYNDTNYVIDPAINPYQPMTVTEWFSSMSPNTNDTSGVVCNEYTYTPMDACFVATSQSDSTAKEDINRYLSEEWQRVKSLGFEPYEILGDSPPWLGSAY